MEMIDRRRAEFKDTLKIETIFLNFHGPHGVSPNKKIEFLPDLDRGTAEPPLDSLGCDLAASDRSKHNFPEVLYWI